MRVGFRRGRGDWGFFCQTNPFSASNGREVTWDVPRWRRNGVRQVRCTFVPTCGAGKVPQMCWRCERCVFRFGKPPRAPSVLNRRDNSGEGLGDAIVCYFAQ